MTPGLVASFLLLNHSFPRSIVLCVQRIETYLNQLSSGYGLRGVHPALEQVEELRAALLERPFEVILHQGLHEFLDWVQLRFIMLHNAIADAFWRQASAA